MNTFTEKDFDEYAHFLANQESQELRPPSEFVDGVEAIATHGDEQEGDDLPWGRTADIWKLRPGELTIWGGTNGSGKSLLLGMVMLWQMASRRVVIASLEMKPTQTLYRMACQFAGCRPDPKFARRVIESMDDKLWLYDQQDRIASIRMLAMVLYCAKELKADHVVIDSLLKCGMSVERPDVIIDFVNRLQWLAKANNIHIHLVAHTRKKENEHHQTDKMDIRGPGEITDVADNVVMIRRNKLREQAIEKQKANIPLALNEESYLEQKDAYVIVNKNRHGQEEGMTGLYFNKLSMQYTELDIHRPLPAPWTL